MSNFLKEGDVIEINGGHTVYAKVPRHYIYDNRKGDFSLTTHSVKLTGNFEYLQGRYIVVKTEITGGGTGNGANDAYPDGHKVTCKGIDGEFTVSFYQSGCFTAMIKDISPITGLRKEKRWISIKKSNKEVAPHTCKTLEAAKDMYITRWWTHHEIEIEVEV